MAKRIPFMVQARITPELGNGKRFEAVRSREHIAYLIHTDLVANFTDGVIASPGGSGEWALSTSADGLSNLAEGVAVKPSFGNEPDIATIIGFYNGDEVTPHRETTIIHCGEYVTGPIGARGWRSELNPTTANADDAKALKTALEAASTSVTLDIIKMELAGVTYGHGGFHFPR